MLLSRAPHDYPERGEWTPIPAEDEDKQTALVACPECGHRESLEAYSIDRDGNVTPGVRCNEGCGWYAKAVQLLGWRLN